MQYLFAEKRTLNFTITSPKGQPKGVDRQTVGPKNEFSKLKSNEFRKAIEKALDTFEKKKALLEKYAKKMPRVKKIYEKLKKIEEKFNGLLASLGEAKRENRNSVLSKLGVSQRLFKEMNYIHLNSLYLKTAKQLKTNLGKKYDVKGNHTHHTVEIGAKGKPAFAAVKRNADGTYSIVYKNIKGKWEFVKTVRKVDKVQKIIDGLGKKSGEAAKKYAKSPEGQKEQKESLKKQDSVAKALVLLAKNQTVPANMQKDLKAYLSGIQKNKFKEYEVVMNKSLVRIAVARSADGKYYKAYIDCSLTVNGQQPKVLASRPPYSMSAVLNLRPDGKSVGANDTSHDSKFPNVPDAFGPVKTEKGPKKPKGAKEKAPTTPRGKIAKILKEIEGGGKETFRENLHILKAQIQLLGLSYQKDNPQNLKIGGYTINYCEWSKHPEHKPSLVIFKGDGPQVICYKVGKPENNRWYHARPLGRHDTYSNVTWTRRFAERHAANNALSTVLPQLKGEKGDLRFLSPKALKTFQASIRTLAAYSGKDWKASFNGVEVHFNFQTKGFKIIMPNRGGAIDYHYLDPDKYRVPGQKGKKTFATYSARDLRGMNKLKGRLKGERDRETAKKEAKRQAELKKQKEEAAKRKEQQKAREKQREALTKTERTKFNLEERQGLKKDLVNSDYDQYVTTPDSSKPYEFDANFGKAKNSKGQLLINKTKIHQLFKLESMKRRGKVLRVTITDSQGKKRYGMYYPGQKSIYELAEKNGKQKSKSLKFSNSDKFKISVSDPTQKDLNAVNDKDRNRTGKDELKLPEHSQLTGNSFYHRRYLTMFKKLGGQITDLDTTKLQKFKDVKSYNPAEIGWDQKRMRKIITDPKGGMKKLNEIMRTEIAILKEGIIKLRVDKKMGGMAVVTPPPAPGTKTGDKPATPKPARPTATKKSPAVAKTPPAKPPAKTEKPAGTAKPKSPEAVKKAKLEQHQAALYKKLSILLKRQNYRIEKDTVKLNQNFAYMKFYKKGSKKKFAYLLIYPDGKVKIRDNNREVITVKKNYRPTQIATYLKEIQKSSDSLKAPQAKLTRKLTSTLGSKYFLLKRKPGSKYARIMIVNSKTSETIAYVRLYKKGKTEIRDINGDIQLSKDSHTMDKLISDIKATEKATGKMLALRDKMHGKLKSLLGTKYKLSKETTGAKKSTMYISRSTKGAELFGEVIINDEGKVKIITYGEEKDPVPKFTKLTPQQIAQHIRDIDAKSAAKPKPAAGSKPHSGLPVKERNRRAA